MFNKVILTDCDGVLLNWEYAFEIWMNEKGYNQVDTDMYDISQRYNISKYKGKELIKLFNESAAIGFLPPLRDAMHYVEKLHKEHGYVLRVITSLSTDPYAGELRARNLKKLFGTAIDSIVCLDTGADKDEALAKYADSGAWWIEDKVENAELGESIGLNSIIMEHSHNMNHKTNIAIVKGWKDIYEIVKD